jgi:hypothetical protein
MVAITGCNPVPKIKSIAKGSIVVFINKDSVEHRITFSPAFNFTVPAGGQREQIFNVWSKPGMRAYSCDAKAAAGKIDMYIPS